jgi:RND family efflux transporter MFP subunit
MRNFFKKYLGKLIIFFPVMGGIIVVGLLMLNKPGPTQKQESETVRVLRTITLPTVDLIPRVIGYGTAKPGRLWAAVSEIKGTIVFINPRLKSGEILEAENLLVQIDPTEYELAVARIEASVEEIKAKLNELAENEDNTRRLIAIEQRSLQLADQSLERKTELLKRDAISRDEVDREERNVIQQKQKVQTLDNTLALFPSRRKALNAALAVQLANLKQAEIDLSKTDIKAPFDCRLEDVDIEVGQFVGAGQSLFKVHGIDLTEVEARFRLEELRNLLSETMRARLQPGLSTGSFRELFNDVRVVIRLQSGDWSVEWEARIDRFREAMDATTREIRVVTVVDRPYEKAIPGVRPPLSEGMFCQVELQSPARVGSIVLPRSTIHEDCVFVLDQEDRLQARQVIVDFFQSEFVVIKSGLSGGEKVVVSDPKPAIIGMKVAPVHDDGLKRQLLDLSQGKRAGQ